MAATRTAAGGKTAAGAGSAKTAPSKSLAVQHEAEVKTHIADEAQDSYAVTAFGDLVDHSLHAAMSHITMGLSPAALSQAYMDWAIHLTFSPGKQLQLAHKSLRKGVRFANYAWHSGLAARKGEKADCCIEPLPQDRRFKAEEWQKWPFNLVYQSFLLNQQWWHNATTGIRGVTKEHEAMVEFGARQMLDMFSPSNFLLTNPKTLHYTIEHKGKNLVQGMRNFIEDISKAVSGKKPGTIETFKVGENLAVTPGKVIYRNRLIELIQYQPATEKVHPEPVFIVPAWIMKYYILDLSPQNSLVRYLTEQGYTVFILSWKNPGPEDRDLGLDDYRTLGVMAALEVINTVVPEQKIHAMGYCLGGTLLSLAAAAMGRDGDERLKSITLLAAQTDFTEAGELRLFIDESQLAFLEDMMWEQGYLDTTQMAGAFQMLRSKDLVWSRIINEYQRGQRMSMIDLMAWNADGTRMPYRMHSEYLRHMFLNNDLAEGRLLVDGEPVVLSDIRAPMFVVGTVYDHVAPWRSVYKNAMLIDVDFTFLLTSGGHNAGIVAAPDSDHHNYQVLHRDKDGHYLSPQAFLRQATKKDGSWWPEWVSWMDGLSGKAVDPPTMGAAKSGYPPLDDAPGIYVLQE